MPISEAWLKTYGSPYLHVPGSATMEQVLRTFLDREGQWSWLLTTEREGTYYVCSFGSLLPYLTGRTQHIVHRIGDCAICSGMDPLLWRDTPALIAEARADAAIRSRRVSDLPLAELPTTDGDAVDDDRPWLWFAGQTGRVCGVTRNGVLYGVYVARMRGDPGGVPEF